MKMCAMTTMRAKVDKPTGMIAEVQTQLAQLYTDLDALEAQYTMSSELFYQRYQQGQTDDRMDFVEWASLIQMTRNLETRLHFLRGENNL